MLLEDVRNHDPPCVLVAVLKTFFNGWATSARFQTMDKVCLLCFDCDGVDSIEHYASCPFQWKVFADKFRTSMFPCSLPRFIGGYAVELDEKVFHAVHMYAVMSAFNSRKHAGIASGTDAIEALIWNGHRTAQLYHRGLEKRYKSIWP